ncbi:MAG: thiol reductant ABC exporter subunit CydC [Micrococcales bacterium]
MSRRLIALGLPRGRGFWLGTSLAALEATSAVTLLALSAWLISAAAEQPPILYLNEVIVGVRAFALGRAFFRYTQRLTLHSSVFQMLGQLRVRVFESVAPLAPAGLAGIDRADFANRLVHDVDELQNLSLRVITPVVQSLVVTVLTVVGLAILTPSASAAWILAVTAVAATLLAVSATARSNRLAATLGLSARNQMVSATTDLLENLDLHQAYGWAIHSVEQMHSAQKQIVAANTRTALTTGLGTSIYSAFATLAVVASAYLGANAVLAGSLDHRWLAVVALVPIAVFEVLANLQAATGSWQRYRASAQRVLEALDAEVPAEATANQTGAELEHIQTLEVTDATLSYPGSKGSAVSLKAFEVNAGERLLVQGSSGAGKTTLAYALAGFLHPSSGQVLVNGLPLTNYSESSIRARIGYLEQNPTIFAGSLRANLVIGDSNATDETLWAVLERVRLAETFHAREGLDTQLGERGVAVSGGEAQRIALARALLANFQVLIFDEPTANVDGETAGQLWADLLAISTENPDRICIFITHQSEYAEGIERAVSL